MVKSSAPFGPALVDDVLKQDLDHAVYKIVSEIHTMAPASTPGHRGSHDTVYETVRLAALLYAHAIWHRIPFHQAPHATCSFGQGKVCRSTPEMIHQTVSTTNLSDAKPLCAGCEAGTWNPSELADGDETLSSFI